MRFTVRLADQTIEIQSLYDKVYQWCRDYLVPDDALPEGGIPEDRIHIAVTPEDIEREDRATQYQGWKKNPDSFMVYHPAHLELSALYRRICEEMPLHSVMMMHGSVISTDSRGYMFMAPSGVGKTTRTEIWKSVYPQSIIVNGDKPLIRVGEDTVYAYGTPWSGKEGYNFNISVPLQAVFILERAEEGEKDSIQKLSPFDAFAPVYHQAYHPDDVEAKKAAAALVNAFVSRTAVYKLRCAPTEEAIRLAYETAK